MKSPSAVILKASPASEKDLGGRTFPSSRPSGSPTYRKWPWGEEIQTYMEYREDERSPSLVNPSAEDQKFNAAQALLREIFNSVVPDMDGWAGFADTHFGELWKLESLGRFKQYFEENGLEDRLATLILRWVERSGYFRGAVGSGLYSKGQHLLAVKIAEALATQKVVVAGTKNEPPAEAGGLGGSGEPLYEGLAFKHAYSVLKVRRNVSANPESPADGPHTFLQIRNPWGSYKRVYEIEEESWTPQAVDDDGGTFWIELNDFSTNFGDVEIG